jgi:hypothetical protein
LQTTNPIWLFRYQKLLFLSLTFAKLHQRSWFYTAGNKTITFLDNLILPNCQFILSFQCRLVSPLIFGIFRRQLIIPVSVDSIAGG